MNTQPLYMPPDKQSALIVIFGATGDLARRKLMPALYNLIKDSLIPANFAAAAIGRRDQSEQQYKQEIKTSLQKFSRSSFDESVWQKLSDALHYCQFDFTLTSQYDELEKTLVSIEEKHHTKGNRVYYLAVAPEYFETIVDGVQKAGMIHRPNAYSRAVIEKPFGKDLATAKKLNERITAAFPESSIYRIDHYLGKDMIQNIMILRFTNSIFQSIWNNRYIDNIQISLAEQLGVETRGGYYETSGAMRDMVQNHIIQILSLVAMEPPVNLNMDSIRNEKQKVLEAIEDITPEFLDKNVVFGQYGQGEINGEKVPGYREEKGVDPHSGTETFVAIKLHINSFRWAGTPFYIRTGKRMPRSSAEIIIQLKSLPDILYFKDAPQQPNLLVIRIQPKVGVSFQFNTKDFSSHSGIVRAKMEAGSTSFSNGNTPEAYERLLHDIFKGDAGLFSRWDEVEKAWMFADKLISYREKKTDVFPNYAAGTFGPQEAFDLIERDGRTWRNVYECASY